MVSSWQGIHDVATGDDWKTGLDVSDAEYWEKELSGELELESNGDHQHQNKRSSSLFSPEYEQGYTRNLRRA